MICECEDDWLIIKLARVYLIYSNDQYNITEMYITFYKALSEVVYG